MSTESMTAQAVDLDDPVLADADSKAIFAAVAVGTPPDPEIVERVRARTARFMEEYRRTHGVMDDATFQSIINEDDDE